MSRSRRAKFYAREKLWRTIGRIHRENRHRAGYLGAVLKMSITNEAEGVTYFGKGTLFMKPQGSVVASTSLDVTHSDTTTAAPASPL